MTSMYLLLRQNGHRRLGKRTTVPLFREKSWEFARKWLDEPGLRNAHTGPHSIDNSPTSCPSETYLAALSKNHKASVDAIGPSHVSLVKRKIAQLLNSRSYSALLQAITKWTSILLQIHWLHILSQREMAYILLHLIEYQKSLLLEASSLLLLHQEEVTSKDLQMAAVKEARDQIRSIYANILSPPGVECEHLYSKKARFFEEVLGKKGRGRHAFVLSAADYENLVLLELNNGKLDLASRWFQRMENQFGKEAFEAAMTHKLWIMKFRIFGNGQPSLWRVEKDGLKDMIVNPRQSAFKLEKKWLDLFHEFTANEKKYLDKSRTLFLNELVSVMLSSIAHSRNVDQVAKLIEVNWGVTIDGEKASGFVLPSPHDPLFPDLNVLTTIVVAMLYNKRYVAGMSYLNAFQQIYGIRLDKGPSQIFWDAVFRWAVMSTEYSEAKAFQYYINETSLVAFSGLSFGLTDEFPVLLEEAKKSAHFDYEGFLRFVLDLRAQRVGLVSELWKCFLEVDPSFSIRPYWAYLKIAREYLLSRVMLSPPESEQLCSQLCYELLQKMSDEYVKFNVSTESFNSSIVPRTLAKIRVMYTNTMKTLIHGKAFAGNLGEIPHVISKWGLDEEMKLSLLAWARKNEKLFLDRYNQLEKQRLSEEEEESFLDLM